MDGHILKTGEDLQDVLDAHPQELIGKTVTEIKYTKLPYLSKVLSAAKALPLHLHPVCYRHAFLEHLTSPKYRTRTLRVNSIAEIPRTSLIPTTNPKLLSP